MSTHCRHDPSADHLSEEPACPCAFRPRRRYIQWPGTGSTVKPPLEESDFHLRYLQEAITTVGDTFLDVAKVEWVVAAYNAEDTLAALSRVDAVDLCYSVDSDLVPLEAKLVIRPVATGNGPFVVFSRRAALRGGLLPANACFHAGFSSKDYVFLHSEIRQRQDLLRAVGFRNRDFADAVALRYLAAFPAPGLPPQIFSHAEARSATRVEVSNRLKSFGQGKRHEEYIDMLCEALLDSVLMYACAPVALSLGSAEAVIVPIRLFAVALQGVSIADIESLLTSEERLFLARNVAATEVEFSVRARQDSSIDLRDIPPLYSMVAPLQGRTPGEDYVLRRDKRQAVFPRTGASIASHVYRPVLGLFTGCMRKSQAFMELTKGAKKVSS